MRREGGAQKTGVVYRPRASDLMWTQQPITAPCHQSWKRTTRASQRETNSKCSGSNRPAYRDGEAQVDGMESVGGEVGGEGEAWGGGVSGEKQVRVLWSTYNLPPPPLS